MHRPAEYQMSNALSSKQKGDIAEARVAELIVLYGRRALSCYKPLSDDEGIDLIVKEKGTSLKTLYLQVKSRFGSSPPASRQFVQTPAKESIVNSYQMALIFVYFDPNRGDIHDKLWFVPAPDFIERAHLIPANEPKRRKARYRFNTSIKTPSKSPWAVYCIDKRGLADAIIDHMSKL
jgi:hypothetical protein